MNLYYVSNTKPMIFAKGDSALDARDKFHGSVMHDGTYYSDFYLVHDLATLIDSLPDVFLAYEEPVHNPA